MTWHTPKTWNVGEYVTALLFNQQLRDNMNHIKNRIDSNLPVSIHTSASGEWTTTSTTFVDVGTISLTYTYNQAHHLLMWLSTKARIQTTGGTLYVDINLNGNRLGNPTAGLQTLYIGHSALVDSLFPLTIVHFVSVVAGTYTIKPQFAVTSGTTAKLGFGTTQFGRAVLKLPL